MEEKKLIKGCIRGDRTSQKVLYDRYAPVFLGICYRYCPNYDIANDVLQESFIKIFKSIKGYKGEGSFEGWMKRICVNTALSELRKHKPTIPLENVLFELGTANIPGDENDIIELITKLPDGYREIFNLHGIEGYSFKEIAGLMELTEVNVRVRYHRAKKKMQDILEKYFMEVR